MRVNEIEEQLREEGTPVEHYAVSRHLSELTKAGIVAPCRQREPRSLSHPEAVRLILLGAAQIERDIGSESAEADEAVKQLLSSGMRPRGARRSRQVRE